MVGRGASDAKGPLCAIASALAAVCAAGVDLAGAASLSSVVDEEQGGGGTLAWIGRGLTADAAVVGEPTRLAVCPATRGSRRFWLQVEGRSAHPGEAFDGVNAILKAYLYIDALYDLGLRLDRERPHQLWRHLPLQHVFNLNGIEGGAIGTAGSVPDGCTFEMAVGATAAETLEHLEEEVEAVIAAVTEL